jgi:DNA-binding response OmpR family regulator
VADDDRDAAANLVKMLALEGYDTRTAHDGLEALELAEAFRPEVILLDLSLQGLNGSDTCRRIRQQAWGNSIFVVAMTGWGQQDNRFGSREAGFDHHMIKPIDLASIQQILRDLAVPDQDAN